MLQKQRFLGVNNKSSRVKIDLTLSKLCHVSFLHFKCRFLQVHAQCRYRTFKYVLVCKIHYQFVFCVNMYSVLFD